MVFPPSSKQLNYLGALAAQLGEGDEWDMFEMSRSKAQRKATAVDASRAIESALERLETKKRRSTMIDGDWDGERIRISGCFYHLKAEVGQALRDLQAAGPVDLPRLLADRNVRVNTGAEKPWTEAIAAAAIAQPAAVAERLAAIAQIRALMAQHHIAASEL